MIFLWLFIWCSLWFSYDFPMCFLMIFLWLSYDYPMISDGFLMIFLWLSYDFLMIFLCLYYDFPMNFLCFPMIIRFSSFAYDFPVIFLWLLVRVTLEIFFCIFRHFSENLQKSIKSDVSDTNGHQKRVFRVGNMLIHYGQLQLDFQCMVTHCMTFRKFANFVAHLASHPTPTPTETKGNPRASATILHLTPL